MTSRLDKEKIKKEYEFFLKDVDYDDPGVEDVILDILNSGLTGKTLSENHVQILERNPDKLKNILGFDNGLNFFADNRQVILFRYENPKDEFDVLLDRVKILPPINKDIKYLSPKDSKSHVYIPKFTRAAMGSSKKELIITEGEKKTLLLSQLGFNAVGLSGIWQFKESEGDQTLLEDLVNFGIKRNIYVAFDNDRTTNANVRRALMELVLLLKRNDANVFILEWAKKKNYKGIDDYLVAQTDIQTKLYITNDDISKMAGEMALLMGSAKPYTSIFTMADYNSVKRILAKPYVDFAVMDEIMNSVADNSGISKTAIKRDIKEILDKKNKSVLNELEESVQDKLEIIKKTFSLNYTPVIDTSKYVILPHNNEIWLHSVPKQNKTFIDEIKPKPITPFFIVSEIITDNDNEKSYKLISADKNSTIITFLETAQKDNFTSIMSHFVNMPLDENVLREIKTYISDYFINNMTNIPKVQAIKRTGWVGNDFFIPTLQKNDIVFVNEDLKNAYTANGDYNIQMEYLKTLLQTRAGLPIIAALTAPIIDLTCKTNFFINIAGLSGTGKTTIALFIMSLFGNPKLLKLSFFATKVGLEYKLHDYSSLPILIDEFQTSGKDAEIKFIELIYQVSSEIGKVRGMKTGGAAAIKNIKSLPISTMESNIKSLMQKPEVKDLSTGVFRRLFEFKFEDYEKIYPEGFDLTKFNSDLNDNYGHFGMAYIKYILEHKKNISDTYQKNLKEIRKQKKYGGVEGILSTMLTSIDIMQDILNIDTANIRTFFNEFMDEKSIEMQSMRPEQWVDDVISNLTNFIAINNSKFYSFAQETDEGTDVIKSGNTRIINVSWYGQKTKSDDNVYFITTLAFKEFCSIHKYPIEQALSQLDKFDKIIKSPSAKDRKTHTSPMRIPGTNMRTSGYKIKLANPIDIEEDIRIDEIIERENESQNSLKSGEDVPF